MNSPASQASDGFVFTDSDFNKLRDTIKDIAGISLSDQKKELVYGRLTRRLRALRLQTFKEYLEYLEEHTDTELELFTNALTTNLTSFFRENHHFEMMATDIHPWLLQRYQQTGRLRIWSAGCSTGEEPYSIAITIAESVPDAFSKNIKILATDLDTDVVAKAASGVYADNRIEGLPKERVKKWFVRGTGDKSGFVKVSDKLRDMITFKPLNLMHSWPMKGPFDVIFCRNVVIYFDKPTQAVLFDRYADMLCDSGVLFIGHSETMAEVCNRFELVGKTMYRKLY